MKILLSGYYGFDNAGDDAVLFAIVQALREIIPDVDITVLSNQPEKTAQQFGVKAVDRWGKTSLPKAIKDCDVLISGGGSLLQDVTSKNGILYYLGVIKLAQMMRKKVIVYAQGIGPVNEPRNRALVAKILNKVQAITVRDFDSRRELMEMGVYREIMVAVDPVLGISADSIDEAQGLQLLRGAEAGYIDGKKTLMVAARNWKHSDRFFKEIAESCDAMAEQGWQVVFVPFHYPEDVEAGRNIASLMKRDAVVLSGNYSPQETMAVLKNADLIMGMRLHSLIMGAALLKPMVGLSYDPKVTSFMQLLRQPDCYPVDSVEAAQLIRSMNRLSQQTDHEKLMLARNMEIIARQAKAPAEMILTLRK
ncbi:MAG: polysaccharide pyruvyl transferase CsaB [Peptococcaceae bacterium]|nr:polysaccharide pyruvyl transferase CsaB [Peptococcaceae bacterium]MBQ3510541.1 polysaccharide pyruvyl transferase CsaB [Peptococcaceae bacterium]